MEHEFWHKRWNDDAVPFHEGSPNQLLVNHADAVPLASGARVLVPLCGKAFDMQWLAERGCRVVGVELSPVACRAFFEENGLEVEVRSDGPFTRFESDAVTLLCGDFFELDRAHLGAVDTVYDRAALVALPPGLRARYAEHLVGLVAPSSEMLVVTFEYRQADMDGPPFSVPLAEVASHYGDTRAVRSLEVLTHQGEASPLIKRGLAMVREHAIHVGPEVDGG